MNFILLIIFLIIPNIVNAEQKIRSAEISIPAFDMIPIEPMWYCVGGNNNGKVCSSRGSGFITYRCDEGGGTCSYFEPCTKKDIDGRTYISCKKNGIFSQSIAVPLHWLKYNLDKVNKFPIGEVELVTRISCGTKNCSSTKDQQVLFGANFVKQEYAPPSKVTQLCLPGSNSLTGIVTSEPFSRTCRWPGGQAGTGVTDPHTCYILDSFNNHCAYGGDQVCDKSSDCPLLFVPREYPTPNPTVQPGGGGYCLGSLSIFRASPKFIDVNYYITDEAIQPRSDYCLRVDLKSPAGSGNINIEDLDNVVLIITYYGLFSTLEQEVLIDSVNIIPVSDL